MHAYKKKYFRLDIIIGKIDFFHAWDLFSDEDELALLMLEQFKAYEIRTSLAMIPFYREKKKFIQEALDNLRSNSSFPGPNKTEVNFLRKQLDEVTRKLE